MVSKIKNLGAIRKFEFIIAPFYFGCIINGVDGRNFYQCHFLIKKVETIKFSC